MKRVVFLIQDQPNWTGGPIINIRRLLPALKELGYEVLALAGYRQDAPNARYLESKGIACALYALPAATENYVAWIVEQVLLFKADVFVGDTHVAGGYAIKYLNAWGIPSIVMARSVDAYSVEIIQQFFIKSSEYRAQALVCVNSNIVRTLIPVGLDRTDQIRVIPSGGPVSPFTATYQNSPFRLVFAGVLREEPKRLLKLWNDFVFAHAALPNLTLTFIGEGPLKPVLEELVKQAGLSESVNFTGILYEDHYKEALAKHQALLLFSDFEGTPGSVMDAMSCGVVPLCRNIPGIDFLVKNRHNGLLFDGTKEDFLTQLKALQSQDEWERLSSQAKLDFEREFSLSTVVQRWSALLDGFQADQAKLAKAKVPTRIRLAPVRFHLANADRRKHPFYKLLRGFYIVIQRAQHALIKLKKLQ